MAKKLKDSDVFLKAAKDIDAGVTEFSCLAIVHATGKARLCVEYENQMPLDSKNTQILFNYDGSLYNRTPSFYEAKEHRVYMLLLMWAILKSEGR